MTDKEQRVSRRVRALNKLIKAMNTPLSEKKIKELDKLIAKFDTIIEGKDIED